MSEAPIAIHWFRRDLRLNDNHALYGALTSGQKVLPVFIFDTDILGRLEDKRDARVQFIYDRVQVLKRDLEQMGSSLLTFKGNPLEAFQKITSQYVIGGVYANRDYEPEAIKRDELIKSYLEGKGIAFTTAKDQVFFEAEEVVKDDGSPYTVFTPYSRKWKQKMEAAAVPHFSSEALANNFLKVDPLPYPGLEALGFQSTLVEIPALYIDRDIIRNYAATRDIPSIKGTTRLGLHLRFGTVSIRELIKIASEEGTHFLNELIWRDFFSALMSAFPYVVSGSFRKPYDFIEWRNDTEEFEQWCRGETGYPLVDAGMRELNRTGFMHNRIRMVTASFLTKHLLIDWRWGEAYFALKLLDYDMASNNGNWQWAAGTGADAAPYFRVFNPALQMQRFDPDSRYVRMWVPEWGTSGYPTPLVDHTMARERALAAYKKVLKIPLRQTPSI